MTQQTQRQTAKAVGAFVFAVLGPAMLLAGAANRRPPNVVVVLADDLGHTDVGCYGSRCHETPHIARPAAQGMFFTSGYTCGPNYAAMIASVDDSIGRLVAVPDELKLTANTLVIFSGDNGGGGGYEREGIKGGSITDNAPLKGRKGMPYEGGIRVPFIFRWPDSIAPGSVCDEPINSVDLYPTLLELAGVEPPRYPLDGESYLSLSTHGRRTEKSRSPLFWHFPGDLGAGTDGWRTTPVGVIRSGHWKPIEFFEDGRLKLYNLCEDIGEKNNLATAKFEKAKELHGQLLAWRKELQAPMPTPNRDTGKPCSEAAAKPVRKNKRGAGDDKTGKHRSTEPSQRREP